MMTNESILEDATAYFDRRKDRAAIRNSVKVKYGTGIKIVQDKNNPKVSIETYTREETAINVDSGIYEVVNIGFGPKVVGALSNLFSEPGQVFSLFHETKEAEALEDADKLLTTHRKNGGYRKAMTEADERSIQVGAGAVVVTFTGGTLAYEVYIASRVRCYFPETILERVNNVEVTRSPDRTDIEDCYAVVLRVSSSDEDKNGYLAIFGRSIEWPNGRHVQYQAKDSTTEIPMPGDDSIIYEYEFEGGPANPLSIQANQNLDISIPEYPISIILGTVKDDDKPMPASTSLYEESLEFDVSSSHALGKGNEAAGGANVIELDEVGEGKPLPRTLQGDIVTQAGQKMVHISKSAEDAKVAYELIKDEMVDAAAGHGVPDYYMTSEDHTVEASSGVALEIKSRPLKKVRDRRIETNENRVNKVFEIEKWLIVAHDKDASEATVTTLRECSQAWQPGKINLPQNKTELMAELTQAGILGLMDTIAQLKKYYQLATDTEAIALYEKFKERAVEFPPIQIIEPVKKPVGLLRGRQNGNT